VAAADLDAPGLPLGVPQSFLDLLVRMGRTGSSVISSIGMPGQIVS